MIHCTSNLQNMSQILSATSEVNENKTNKPAQKMASKSQ